MFRGPLKSLTARSLTARARTRRPGASDLERALAAAADQRGPAHPHPCLSPTASSPLVATQVPALRGWRLAKPASSAWMRWSCSGIRDSSAPARAGGKRAAAHRRHHPGTLPPTLQSCGYTTQSRGAGETCRAASGCGRPSSMVCRRAAMKAIITLICRAETAVHGGAWRGPAGAVALGTAGGSRCSRTRLGERASAKTLTSARYAGTGRSGSARCAAPADHRAVDPLPSRTSALLVLETGRTMPAWHRPPRAQRHPDGGGRPASSSASESRGGAAAGNAARKPVVAKPALAGQERGSDNYGSRRINERMFSLRALGSMPKGQGEVVRG